MVLVDVYPAYFIDRGNIFTDFVVHDSGGNVVNCQWLIMYMTIVSVCVYRCLCVPPRCRAGSARGH